MIKAKKIVLKKKFEGFPKETDFSLEEEELPSLKDGDFLAKAVYLSVDPYQRAYVSKEEYTLTNDAFMGFQVAKIVESKNSKYPVGKFVVGHLGWRTHTIANDKGEMIPPYVLPDFGDLPVSLALGVLGMTGNTAYFGFLEICQPKPGETVVVSGAAGAVGSHVGQLAKIKGCKVIGIAGSDEKGKWLTQELGFDYFINYKTADIQAELKKAAPNGIDCYFDNVGGEISSTVIYQMNKFGRISVCGSIGHYNDVIKAKATTIQIPIVMNELKMEGFIVTRWANRYMEGIHQNMQWVKEGKLKYQETITDGFENTFKAFSGMLKGENIGKAIVKV